MSFSEENNDRNKNRDMNRDKGKKGNKNDNKRDIPIINTTTLKINVKTIGDLTTKEYDLIPFHPNMSEVKDITKNKNYILFPSFVKITMKDLKQAGIGTDYQTAFLDLDKYIRVIKYVTAPEKEYDPTLLVDKSDIKNYTVSLAQNALASFAQESDTDVITIQKDEPLSQEEIITNNIALIKSLFFPVKGKFFILGNEYIIGKSSYIPKYVQSTDTNTSLEKVDSHQHNIPLFYTITVELQLLDAINNPGVGDFGRMSCKAKKASIAKEAQEVFGTNFGYVEEKKATVPSILHTSEVSKDRNFGQLQLDWEKRNKYQKEPTSERERLEMERSMTPLQKKMAELERKQKELGEVPPLWEKETKELDKKYENFETKINELREEYKNISEDNKDDKSLLRQLQDSIKDKMYNEVLALGIEIPIKPFIGPINENETEEDRENRANEQIKIRNDTIDALKTELSGLTKKPLEIKVVEKKRKEEENLINQKHVEPFLKKYKTIDNAVTLLEDQERNLKEEIKRLNASSDPGDKYKVTSFTDKLLKLQTDIRKKKADVLLDANKFGTNGEFIIKKWKDILQKRKMLFSNVDNEKKRESIKIKKDAVEKELRDKFDQLKKLNKELLIAKFYEGILTNLTKEQEASYEKEKRPDNDSNGITLNIESLEEDYLDTAGKINDIEKMQALLRLFSEYLNTLKKEKSDIEREKRKIEGDISIINSDISRFLSSRGIKALNTKVEAELKKDSEYSLKDTEKKDLIAKLSEITSKLKERKDKIVKIEKIIKESKKPGTKYDYLKNKYHDKNNQTETTSSGGSNNNRKRKSKRLYPLIKKRKYRYKTKRMMKSKNKNKNKSKKGHKTLRRLKNRIKKKKYTLRRRRV